MGPSLSSKRAGHPCVSVAGYFPPSVERDRIAFLRVLVSRRETGEVAVPYSGAATGEEISGGSARWFECYRPPWIFDDDPNATDDDEPPGMSRPPWCGSWRPVKNHMPRAAHTS